MDREEILLLEIKNLIAQNNLGNNIEYKKSETGYHIWLKRIDKIRRHIWIRTLGESELDWHYGSVYGEYPAWEDYPKGLPNFSGFDSRTIGNLDFMIRFFTGWLIDNKDWRDLPSAKAEYEKLHPDKKTNSKIKGKL